MALFSEQSVQRAIRSVARCAMAADDILLDLEDNAKSRPVSKRRLANRPLREGLVAARRLSRCNLLVPKHAESGLMAQIMTVRTTSDRKNHAD
jgi:hypothetical protein